MAPLSFPIAQATLGDTLPVQVVDWQLQHYQEFSQANNEFLTHDLAPPLWKGSVQLRPLLNTQARAMMAMLDALDGSIQTFYLANPLGWYPQDDPGGAILGASTVTILSIETNRKELAFTGLPAGYVLSPGDFFSVSYSGGDRRGLFRLVGGGTANGGGETGAIEVRPHLQAGISATNVVSFAKPAAKVKLVPGSLQDSYHNNNRRRISFEVQQTLQSGA